MIRQSQTGSILGLDLALVVTTGSRIEMSVLDGAATVYAITYEPLPSCSIAATVEDTQGGSSATSLEWRDGDEVAASSGGPERFAAYSQIVQELNACQKTP
mmetsp:Transcript_67063/g.118675  ORF Transcript_67063/g.118675 Transcript_67063/m.118675 type:complete len:101 (+) Transcript_67063:73-375(+)|eukprot:CAMPEP_0197714714 /NCGR_PEP_ID=MMETSP1338-20131121/131098_1 /TAXON_ID=43686 ORGANISM="Pelagodinium beii, Strain RCC1491" /NCGR_SAMPLE_ID=MMETSP1338 /ASSEMBLY_ACC=CAM_ASM_000754 /LENGTH=100 /DNA_ID=CAMNT_0043298657 /DNA_START=427 /DNA_END=729 /DNA_ORIENTATION=-